jgi:uncharacterized protein (DUF2384 family)
MSDERAAPAAAPEPELASAPAPGRPRFRGSRSAQQRLTPDEAVRQGTAARLAWSAFQDRDRVVAFLNSHDEALGGRPIDLAIASDAGLAVVTDAINISAAQPGGSQGDAHEQAAAAHGPASPTD